MPTRSARLYSLALLVGDFCVLLLAFGLAYIVRVGIPGFTFDSRPLVVSISALDFIQTALLLVPIWIIVFAFLGLYSSRVYTKRLEEWGRILIGSFIGILVVLGYSFVIDEPVFPARLVAVYAFVGSFLLLILGREAMRLARGLMFRFGRGISRVLIIGDSLATRDIAEELSDTKRSGYHISAMAGPKEIVPTGFKGVWYPTVEEALEQLNNQHITTIIQTDMYTSGERNQKILSAAMERHLHYSFIPGEPEFYSGKNSVDVFLGYPIISVYQTPLTGWGVIVKRLFDVIVGSLMIIVLSPILLLIVVLQKIFNPGPVFYVQRRLTRFSTPFDMVKFRTMRHLPGYENRVATEEFKAMGREDLIAEYNQYRKVKNDPRITWFGQFLRRTSIDELPQLYNVMKSDLSLVGPRPIMPDEIASYRGKSSLLHSVKSGMTGLWQVSGRSELAFEKRVELELYYAQNWSFWMDVRILLKTFIVLFKKGRALVNGAPKIAIVYDWLTNVGGGERNLLSLHQVFPDAPIYTSVYIPEACPQFASADVRTTYLQKLPKFLRKRHQLLPVFRPAAFRALNLQEYDIIISMGSAEAKAVRKRPDALHINYCFTPTRYYWSHYKDYKHNPGFGLLNPLIRLVIPLFVAIMRRSDLKAAAGVDRFIGNSRAIAARVKQYYNKDAVVIYPPLDMARFRQLDLNEKRRGYVVVGRQVTYKRLDLAIEACNKLKVGLTLYGNGPQHKQLMKIAGPTIKFVVGTAGGNDTEIEHALATSEGFINPQEEDFGLTHVEAMAAGCPVIAFAKGGALDTMIESKTGVLFTEQTVDSLAAALTRIKTMKFDPKSLQLHAEQFSEERFIQQIKDFVAQAYSS